MVNVKTIYTSACANNQENNLACSEKELFFSRTNAIFKVNLTKPYQQPEIILRHDQKINGFKIIPTYHDSDTISDDGKTYLISTTLEKCVIIWQISSDRIESEMLFKLESPSNDEFMTRSAIRFADGTILTIASTLDNQIHFWKNECLICSKKTSYCCLDIKIHKIKLGAGQFDCFFIFIAGTDNKLHVFNLQIDFLKNNNINEQEPCNPFHYLMDLSGHSDWIKCIEVLGLPQRGNELLVATSSLDSYVRIWHLKIINDEFSPYHVRTAISNPINISSSLKTPYKLKVTLETVLSGHEAAVTCLCWFQKDETKSLRLLTCSKDKSVVLWQAELADPSSECITSGKWIELYRCGETGETNLPFLNVSCSPKSTTFYAQSLHGAIHSFDYQNGGRTWRPGRSLTGHFEPVTSLSWELDGSYLLSVSLDKTCRLHNLVKCDNSNINYWAELARPLVHGYDINAVASTSFDRTFIGASEMTLRQYQATEFFIKNFISLSANLKTDQIEIAKSLLNNQLPKHGQLSALGLTIKGSQYPYDAEVDTSDKNAMNNMIEGTPMIQQVAAMDHLVEVPIEEILLQSTLWWESNKLFGHGTEIYALDYASKESFLASASKANRSDIARMIIWDTNKSRRLCYIQHHSLTVTRLRFSPSNQYLLSVSRDRTWCICKRNDSPRVPYVKVIGTTKETAIHERIIWDCAWTWDEKYFITVSRDKKALIWDLEEVLKHGETTINSKASKTFDSSVQAIDTVPYNMNNYSSLKYLAALGFENSTISLVSIHIALEGETQWDLLKTIEIHQLSIRRLAFKPSEGDKLLLATASDDCVVNILEIDAS